LNGRGLAVRGVCQAFLERIERMWNAVGQAKFGQLTEQMLHRGWRGKAEATWLCCASARA
jgi:hypothetical protein